MDKLTTISATLFLAADIFAIVALAVPDWIVTDVGGKTQLQISLLWPSLITSHENQSDVLINPLIEFFFRIICRRNTTRTHVDMHHTLQPVTSLLHTRAARRMVDCVGPNLHWMHLHHHDHHPAGVEQLGPQCDQLRAMGRLHGNGAVLLCGRRVPAWLPRP